MPVAVSVATRSGLSPVQVADLAHVAEGCGLSALYLAESVADSFVFAQAALAATSTLVVGTAIANARVRHAAATAMTTAALDELSGGRFRLGLGVSNARLNEGSLGMAPIRPVEFMDAYVRDVRRVLERAAEIPLDRAPRTHRLPVAIAAMQPRMLRLSGAVADRAILSLTTLRTLPAALDHVAAGASGAGRVPADVAVSCVLPCCLDDDAGAALEAGRGVVLGYARHPAAAKIFSAHGFAERLPLVIAALDRGERATAATLIDAELVEAFVALGPAATVERAAAYAAAGVVEPILFPVPAGDDWSTALRRAVDVATAPRTFPPVDRLHRPVRTSEGVPT